MFEEIQRKIQKVTDEVNGEHDLNIIFSPDFIQATTKFTDISEFFEKSPFEVKTQEDFSELPEDALDGFTNENTDFATWTDFKTEAGKNFAAKKFKEHGF